MKKILMSAISIVLLSTIMFFVSCDKEDVKNAPLISNVVLEGSQVGPFMIKATILDDNGDLKSAELYYKVNTAATFTVVVMTKGTGNEYSGEIPAQSEGDIIYYYIKAVNSIDLITLEPADAPATTKQYTVGGINYAGIVINEIWAGAATDNEKFIELFNTTNEAIDISGVYFERNNEGTVGTIPANTIMAAGAYYILGTKNNTTNPSNPGEPYDNSISSGFSAKKSIRFKMLTPTGNQIDVFLRGDESNLDANISDMAPKSYSRIPNGTGMWKAVDNPTLRAANDGTGAIDIPNS
jgi:hypothetical protein